MNIIRLVASFFLFFALSINLCAYQVIDSTGKKFDFKEPPRVISLSPAISESICAVGAENYLIGISKFCNYPEILKNTTSGKAISEALSKKEVVGGFIDADFEKIVSLKPELVILHDISADFLLKKFESLGIKVFLVYADGLENIAKNTELLGALFNKTENGRDLAKQILREISPIKVEKRPRAIFLFGNMSAGINTYAGQLLQNCGFENVVKKTKADWVVLPKEFILISSPELIIIQSDNDGDFNAKKSQLKKDAVWSKILAVKNDNIFMMPTDLIITPSPRIVYAGQWLKDIHKKFSK